MFYKKEDIDSHFICPFCSETLRDPRILRCGISACHECIQNRIDPDTQELECSSCMKKHSPANNEEGFYSNVVFSRLIETKANQVYRSQIVDKLKSKLDKLKTECEEFSANLDKGQANQACLE